MISAVAPNFGIILTSFSPCYELLHGNGHSEDKAPSYSKYIVQILGPKIERFLNRREFPWLEPAGTSGSKANETDFAQ